MSHGQRIVEKLAWLDEKLAAKGFPRLSPWWRATLSKFYLSGKRQLVLRVGRRGGKSSSLMRVAVVEALFGQHSPSPGDPLTVAIISVDRGEAAKRLIMIGKILGAIGRAYTSKKDAIETTGDSGPVIFDVMTASLSGVVGSTCCFAFCDEVCTWSDEKTGANPASEVLASLRPTMATQRNARLFLSSSPRGRLDAHYAAFEKGETDLQMIAHAPTWLAHPELTEEQLRLDEDDARAYAMNYAAIPQDGTASALDAETIPRAWRPVPRIERSPRPVLIMDSNNGGSDTFAYGIASWCTPSRRGFQINDDGYDEAGNIIGHGMVVRRDAEGRIQYAQVEPRAAAGLPYLLFHKIGGIEGRDRELRFDEMIAKIAREAKVFDVKQAYCDQGGSAPALLSEFSKHKIDFECTPWRNKSKEMAVSTIRRWFRDSAILFAHPHETLKRQLFEYTEKITASGAIKFEGRGKHDDYASVIVHAAVIDNERLLQGSPLHRPAVRITSGEGFTR